MDNNAIFYKDFRDLCHNLKGARTFDEVELLLVYAFAMCDYLNTPVAGVYTKYGNPELIFEKGADKENEEAVSALWLGFVTILKHGEVGISEFTAMPYRDTDGHILKVGLSGVRATFKPDDCSLSYDFDEYYQEATAPPINMNRMPQL